MEKDLKTGDIVDKDGIKYRVKAYRTTRVIEKDGKNELEQVISKKLVKIPQGVDDDTSKGRAPDKIQDELKEAILADLKENIPIGDICKRHNISRYKIQKIRDQYFNKKETK